MEENILSLNLLFSYLMNLQDKDFSLMRLFWNLYHSFIHSNILSLESKHQLNVIFEKMKVEELENLTTYNLERIQT